MDPDRYYLYRLERYIKDLTTIYREVEQNAALFKSGDGPWRNYRDYEDDRNALMAEARKVHESARNDGDDEALTARISPLFPEHYD